MIRLLRTSPFLLTALLIAPLSLLLAPRAVAAQQVAGVGRTDAGEPVGGMMVMLLADGQRTVHAAVTDGSGRFTLRAPRPGTYHVRAEAIGYATTTIGPLEVDADGISALELIVVVQPIQLGALEVEGVNQCRVRPEDGMPAHTLWEEAAKALRSAALLQEMELVEYTVVTYEREVILARGITRTDRHPPQTVRGRPFATRSPSDLADHGYVELHDDDVFYHGPDAHVLLSDDFLDTHCIRVERRGAERAGLTGIAFEPVRGRAVPDIEGVLWLDNSTGELQYLTYDYTGLDIDRIAPASGRIEFERLPAGGWIVQRWWIRMMHTAPIRGAGTSRRATAAYLEVGGEVSDVRRTGG